MPRTVNGTGQVDVAGAGAGAASVRGSIAGGAGASVVSPPLILADVQTIYFRVSLSGVRTRAYARAASSARAWRLVLIH